MIIKACFDAALGPLLQGKHGKISLLVDYIHLNYFQVISGTALMISSPSHTHYSFSTDRQWKDRDIRVGHHQNAFRSSRDQSGCKMRLRRADKSAYDQSSNVLLFSLYTCRRYVRNDTVIGQLNSTLWGSNVR